MNLRDQLLKAGLVNKKQAAEAARDVRKQQKVEEGHREAKRVLEQKEAERLAAEKAAREAELLARRRASRERAERETRALQVRHILSSHRLRVRGPQRFYHRSPDGRELWKLWLPERVAEDLRCGRAAIAYIPGADPHVVVIDREAADRVEAIQPELVLFRNRGRPDADPSEQLYEG
ncbi:MAG: DUF2058 family protein [Myxococcota bacterium]